MAEILGHMACPECGGEAEVKSQKNGMAYRWCPDCKAQYFTRNAEASDRLLAKCGTEKPVPVPVTAPFGLGNVTSITTTTTQAPVPVPVSASKTKPKASPFDILGQFNK